MYRIADSLGSLGNDLISASLSLDHSLLVLRRFHLAGLVIDAWFSDSRYAEMCTRNLAQQVIANCDNPADSRLYLLDCDTLGWPQTPRWAEDVFERQAANQQLSHAGLRGAYLHDPRVWQFYDEHRQIGVQLVRRPSALPAWESGGPLRVFLHWAYMAKSRHLCHAASLGINGRGILLVGAGGSGKSGTTLAGIASGMETVGDDYCLIENCDNGSNKRITAYPLYRILKQDVAGVERVLGSTATADLGPLNWQEKYEIHVSALSPMPLVRQLEICAIIVPRIARSASSVIKPVSPGLAMRAFAPSSSFQLPDGERQGITFTANLCRVLPCMELELSQDPAEIGLTIRNFLEQLHKCPSL